MFSSLTIFKNLHDAQICWQILRSSPSITVEVLTAFENALSTTSSAKEQKQYIKSLLLQAGGSNLKALASKSSTSITNLASKLAIPCF